MAASSGRGAEGAVAAVAVLERVPDRRRRGLRAERWQGWQLGSEAVSQESGGSSWSLGR